MYYYAESTSPNKPLWHGPNYQKSQSVECRDGYGSGTNDKMQSLRADCATTMTRDEATIRFSRTL